MAGPRPAFIQNPQKHPKPLASTRRSKFYIFQARIRIRIIESHELCNTAQKEADFLSEEGLKHFPKLVFVAVGIIIVGAIAIVLLNNNFNFDSTGDTTGVIYENGSQPPICLCRL